MHVCRMRKIPVIIFINKMDREGQDAFTLLDQIEKKLKLKVTPLSWPIGIGDRFKGVYSIYEKKLLLFDSNKTKLTSDVILIEDIFSNNLDELVGISLAKEFREELELVTNVYDSFDISTYLSADVAPVFFGSALNNFGVRELLDCFIDIAPGPLSKKTDVKIVKPTDDKFSGFIFKIHANLDPKHRDRIAFLRVCSGVFKRNTFYYHVRHDKKIKFSNPTNFMGDTKHILEQAYPGDVIGLYDSGIFKIGDSLTDGEKLSFYGIPNFSPEIFKELKNLDPMKSKQLDKGIRQLTEEGVAQLFVQEIGSKKIIGTVGELQFEVIKYRLEHEYAAKCIFTNLSYYKACWVDTEDKTTLDKFIKMKQMNIVRDKDEKLVFLADSPFLLQMAEQDYPQITFHMNSDF